MGRALGLRGPLRAALDSFPAADGFQPSRFARVPQTSGFHFSHDGSDRPGADSPRIVKSIRTRVVPRPFAAPAHLHQQVQGKERSRNAPSRVSQEIELKSHDEFTSAAIVEFFDVNRNSVLTGCANAIGRRFE